QVLCRTQLACNMRGSKSNPDVPLRNKPTPTPVASNKPDRKLMRCFINCISFSNLCGRTRCGDCTHRFGLSASYERGEDPCRSDTRADQQCGLETGEKP